MQVSALRTAISYIKSLQTLVADCDAGRLGEQVYSESRALDSLTNQKPVSRSCDSQPGQSKARSRRTRGKRTPASKRQSLTNQKPVSRSREAVIINQRPEMQRGLNEVSLHISLLDPSLGGEGGLQPQPQTQVLYILQLEDTTKL